MAQVQNLQRLCTSKPRIGRSQTWGQWVFLETRKWKVGELEDNAKNYYANYIPKNALQCPKRWSMAMLSMIFNHQSPINQYRKYILPPQLAMLVYEGIPHGPKTSTKDTYQALTTPRCCRRGPSAAKGCSSSGSSGHPLHLFPSMPEKYGACSSTPPKKVISYTKWGKMFQPPSVHIWKINPSCI